MSIAIVLEDDPKARDKIRDTLHSVGLVVHTATAADEVVEMVEKHDVALGILDINLGPGRQQEGLDALERVRAIDSEVFIGVLSSYPEVYREMADRLDADVFREKTHKREADVLSILEQYYQKRLKELSARERRADRPNEANVEEDLTSDPNYGAAVRHLTNPDWFAEHEGEYVAFVGGHAVHADVDRGALLRWLDVHHAEQPAFILRVGEPEPVLDLSGHFAVEE